VGTAGGGLTMRGLGETCECRQTMARYNELLQQAEVRQKKDAEKSKAEAV